MMTYMLALTPFILTAAAAAAQTWCETFDSGSKISYAAGDAACVMGSWRMEDGLLGSTVGDRYFGTQAVRLRAGRIEMNFDKPDGAGAFSVYVAKYGADADSFIRVECSTDGSNTWFQTGGFVAVTSTVLTRVSIPVQTNAPVRFRISKEGDSRVNIDSVSLSDFGCGPVPPIIEPVAEQSVRVGQTLVFPLTITPTDGDPVTATNAAASAGVTGAWSLANGVFAYTPCAADIGVRGFTFTASDKDGASQPADILVTVRAAQTAAVRMDAVTGSYRQDFDTLALTGTANAWDNATCPLEAWYAYANSAAVETYRTGSGTGTSGGIYAFGAEGSTNRSLGSLAAADISYRYGVAFSNAMASPVTCLDVRFVATQWRVANGATHTLAFEYCMTNCVLPLCQGVWTAVPGLGFDSPVVTNADQAAGAVAVSAERRAVLTEPVQPGDVIILRWRDTDDAGSDHAFGIDELAVTWSVPPKQRGTAMSVY